MQVEGSVFGILCEIQLSSSENTLKFPQKTVALRRRFLDFSTPWGIEGTLGGRPGVHAPPIPAEQKKRGYPKRFSGADGAGVGS